MPATGGTGLVHRVVKRLPSSPTVASVKSLLRPPSAVNAPLIIHSAYVIPSNLAPLLDCLADAPTDARTHLDSLGVRPMWRTNAGAGSTSDAQLESAAKALAPRLRTTADSSVLVVLFQLASRARRAKTASRDASTPLAPEPAGSAPPPAPPPAPSPALPFALPSTLPSAPTSAVDSAEDKERSSSRASSARRRCRLYAASVASDAASEGYLEPLSRPCALQPRPNFFCAPESSAPSSEAWEGEGSDEGAGWLAATGDVFDVDEFDADIGLAVAAARQAVRGMCGPSTLHSRHCLPTSGNWVRLSGGQQHEVTKARASARRRAAAASAFPSFGAEPRLSTSRTWAHQTNSQRLGAAAAAGGTCGGDGGGAGPAARPGSFLPLKACVSTLHGRAGRP